MGMDYLRKIGKYAAIPAAAISLYLAEPAYSSEVPAWAEKCREINTIEQMVDKLSLQEKAELRRYQNRIASNRDAETAYWIMSPYVKEYKEAALDLALPPELALGHAATENSNYKMIMKEAKRRKISPDQAYLSLFPPKSKGLSSARGPFMIKATTAKKQIGMVVSKAKDDRTNPVEAPKGAMNYVASLMEETGSNLHGIAAYNTGVRGLTTKGMNRNYLMRVLAYADIYKQPERFGIKLQERKMGEEFTPPWLRKAKMPHRSKQAPQSMPCKDAAYQVSYRR